jgi:hypothetical protein
MRKKNEMKIITGEKILRIMLLVFFLIVLGNVIEYKFVNKNNLRKIKGKVSEFTANKYYCERTLRRQDSCWETIIKLNNFDKSFTISGRSNRDVYIEDIKTGDSVFIYVREWYQWILTLGYGNDIYWLEKDGKTYYDNTRWKRSNLSHIVIYGSLFLFFAGLFTLQHIVVNKVIKGQKV